MMSNVTCRKVLGLNISSLNPNAQIEVAFNFITLIVKEFLGFPLPLTFILEYKNHRSFIKTEFAHNRFHEWQKFKIKI